MPSIPVHEQFSALTSATNKGVLTVTGGTTGLFPGALAWLSKDDGSVTARVKILTATATTLTVRRFANDNENAPPSYGVSDVSAFNTTSHISMEAQTVPVDPAYTVRSFP